MGTPKKSAELVSPTLTEMAHLLDLGREVGQGLDIERLPEILEEVKKLLLPLVIHLDKPLVGNSLPKTFQNKRALNLLEIGALSIWLDRSGDWMVRIRLENEDRFYDRLNSSGVAEFILCQLDHLLKFVSGGEAEEVAKLEFLKDIVRYDAMVLWVLAQFPKNIIAQIQERERRLEAMKERMRLFGNFVEALDPLAVRTDVELPHFAIFEKTPRGEHRFAGSYLCQEALKPFWELLENGVGQFKEVSGRLRFQSLRNLISRVGFLLGEIGWAQKADRRTARSLIGCNTGRLPFTAKEMGILKEIVRKIQGGDQKDV